MSPEQLDQAVHLTVANVNNGIEPGWSEKQILEAYADLIRTITTDYFNHLVGTEVDLPEAPPLD